MNTKLRKILRYSLLVLALLPLQLAFFVLSRWLYVIADKLLIRITETQYFAINGFGLAFGHGLTMITLRRWKEMRPEAFLAVWQGLWSLGLYFAGRNTPYASSAVAYKMFSGIYLSALLWFLLITAITLLLTDFRRYRKRKKEEA